MEEKFQLLNPSSASVLCCISLKLSFVFAGKGFHVWKLFKVKTGSTGGAWGWVQRTMAAQVALVVLVGSLELAISSRVRPLQTSYYRPSFCPWHLPPLWYKGSPSKLDIVLDAQSIPERINRCLLSCLKIKRENCGTLEAVCQASLFPIVLSQLEK